MTISLPPMQFPDFSGLKARLLSLVKTGRLEWSTLTRTRRADVMVGLTLQCLLMSLPVLVASVARACRVVVVTLYALTVRLATLFGVVRPLRLVKDTGEVREQLEGATLLEMAGFNLVVFEGLKKPVSKTN